MIRVLVAEDSPSIRELLIYILSTDPELKVVGTAENGKEAVDAVIRLKPDIVTMDIHMPIMDGFEATRQIMETQPTPIVIVSGSTSVGEISKSFRTIEVGALAIISRPYGLGNQLHTASAKELVQTVKLMAGVKVVRHWPKHQVKTEPLPLPGLITDRLTTGIEVVAMGGSTGATNVFQTILRGLPGDLPVPVLVVQHMAIGFLKGFSEWLNDTTSFPTSIALHGESLLPGHAYLAPEGFHMGIDNNRRVVYGKGDSENGAIHSVSYLFRSVALCFGNQSIGILLSGMGQDGARELKTMRDSGALTIAQNKESCVVFGMPGAAVDLGAAELVLSPEMIAPVIVNAVRRVVVIR